jgi:hypothetical protein
MESKKVVANGLGNEIEEFDLASYFDASVSIIDLCARQASPLQQNVDLGTFRLCVRARESSYAARSARCDIGAFCWGIAHYAGNPSPRAQCRLSRIAASAIWRADAKHWLIITSLKSNVTYMQERRYAGPQTAR